MKCVKDDLACCGICGTNPVIVMCTHKGREYITEKNAKSQSCRFVIIGNEIPDNPLGLKWQCAVEKAKQYNPNPLIICGSDDFLSEDYINKVQRLVNQGFDLIGVTVWYTYDEKNKKIYHCEYINKNLNFPIGSGKSFSGRLLEKMKYQLFDIKLNKKLDDFGYHSAIRKGAKIRLIRTPEVLAVKQGDDMNSIESYLNSPNIKAIEVKLDVLNFFKYANT